MILFALIEPFARTANIGIDDFKAAVADPAILAAAREAVAETQATAAETPEPDARLPPPPPRDFPQSGRRTPLSLHGNP